MSERSVMTFPCPSCDQILSLSGQQAIGPCPYCQTEIQALFTATKITQLPVDNGAHEKGYDARCFRPDGRPQGINWRAHTPSAQ